jgi:diguanylate cyclase
VSKYKCSLLVVDDEPYILSTLAALLSSEFEILTADSGEAARQHFEKRDIDLILTDQKMPRMSGVQLLEWVRTHHSKTVRLLMTGFAELEEAVEAINRGQICCTAPRAPSSWNEATSSCCSSCSRSMTNSAT